MGKGDRYRDVDKEEYDKNWPYEEKRLNIWPRDKDGNLIDDEDSGNNKCN